MVKWLEEITVTEGESNNFYHFHDNRVLPSHITEALAKQEGERGPRRIPSRPLSPLAQLGTLTLPGTLAHSQAAQHFFLSLTAWNGMYVSGGALNMGRNHAIKAPAELSLLAL